MSKTKNKNLVLKNHFWKNQTTQIKLRKLCISKIFWKKE